MATSPQPQSLLTCSAKDALQAMKQFRCLTLVSLPLEHGGSAVLDFLDPYELKEFINTSRWQLQTMRVHLGAATVGVSARIFHHSYRITIPEDPDEPPHWTRRAEASEAAATLHAYCKTTAKPARPSLRKLQLRIRMCQQTLVSDTQGRYGLWLPPGSVGRMQATCRAAQAGEQDVGGRRVAHWFREVVRTLARLEPDRFGRFVLEERITKYCPGLRFDRRLLEEQESW